MDIIHGEDTYIHPSHVQLFLTLFNADTYANDMLWVCKDTHQHIRVWYDK